MYYTRSRLIFGNESNTHALPPIHHPRTNHRLSKPNLSSDYSDISQKFYPTNFISEKILSHKFYIAFFLSRYSSVYRWTVQRIGFDVTRLNYSQDTVNKVLYNNYLKDFRNKIFLRFYYNRIYIQRSWKDTRTISTLSPPSLLPLLKIKFSFSFCSPSEIRSTRSCIINVKMRFLSRTLFTTSFRQ